MAKVSEYLGHCIFNNIKILKFLADWILFNTKLILRGVQEIIHQNSILLPINFLKNQVELKN